MDTYPLKKSPPRRVQITAVETSMLSDRPSYEPEVYSGDDIAHSKPSAWKISMIYYDKYLERLVALVTEH
jgi:hypothetical protein